MAFLLERSSEHLPFLHRGVGTWHHLTPDHGASSLCSWFWCNGWVVSLHCVQPNDQILQLGRGSLSWQCSTDWRHELGLKPTSNPGGFGAVSPIWGVSPGGRWLRNTVIARFVPSWVCKMLFFFAIRPASMGIELIWLITHDSCCYSGTTAGMFKSGWASENWR